jgi:hypothetical protein
VEFADGGVGILCAGVVVVPSNLSFHALTRVRCQEVENGVARGAILQLSIA